MVEMGVLDPTKVTRSALQNAASVAGLMLTTDAMVAEAPKEEAGHGGMAWRQVAWAAWAVWICNSTARCVSRRKPGHEVQKSPARAGLFFVARVLRKVL